MCVNCRFVSWCERLNTNLHKGTKLHEDKEAQRFYCTEGHFCKKNEKNTTNTNKKIKYKLIKKTKYTDKG